MKMSDSINKINQSKIMETNNTINSSSDDTLSSSFDSLSISDLDSFSSLSPSSTLNFPKYPSHPKMAAFSDDDDDVDGTHHHHFLDSCHLCKKPIGSGRDIFMYRGDMPFCSEECRQEQIEIDEDDEKRVSRSKKEQKSMGSSKNEKIDLRVSGTVVAV